MTYYIDPAKGDARNDGRSENAPLLSADDRIFEPGDIVLFKRGSVIRSALFLCSGNEAGSITYGAYGEGENPTVNPSVAASNPSQWSEESPGIWRFNEPLPSEPCNIIFNDGEAFGNLRWSVGDLKQTGEWTCSRLGYSMIYEEPAANSGTLYLACNENPAKVYRTIELVIWGERKAVHAQSYVVIENMTFEKSGVHGFSATRAQHIHIRNCKFRCIGGGVFDFDQRVRLGNAVEFWNGANDCVVEHCFFEDIYDAGVTHQGNAGSSVPQRLIFRHNLFRRCGLAAYEWRGPSSKDIVFEDNRCMEAGGAFTMQGEQLPRRTETIDDIRACVFVLIWLKEQDLPEDDVSCSIRNNEFYAAPGCEAILLSTLDSRARRQFIINNNQYFLPAQQAPAGQILARINGTAYYAEDYRAYQADTGQDRNSHFIIAEDEQQRSYA